ncbi:MAG: translation elongation factor Ts [bacterium]|nr:translation elongation factor Ts [bacterium]
MANITAAVVKSLRDRTGLPMMECKKALTESEGDEAAAIELLNRKYKGKMEQRADRETGEGRVGVYFSEDRKIGGIVEMLCETAPVAKTPLFIDLVTAIAKVVALQDETEPSPEKILETPVEGGSSVKDAVVEAYSKLQETMNLTSCRRVTGEYLAHYVHHDGKSGVLLSLDAAPSPEAVAVDLAQHAMFTRPLAVAREGLPAEAIEKVRETAQTIAEEEGKPAHIIEKIVQGKVNAFCADNALMEQEHVKPDYDKKRVKDVLKDAGVSGVTDLVIRIIGG